jgi:AcrR family transcriptional regulator
VGVAERKARDFLKREDLILDAAFALFLKHGVGNVTIEMIAEASEIGKGTVYKHFTSKDDIYALLAIAKATPVIAKLVRIEPMASVLDELKMCARIYLEFGLGDLKGYKVFQDCRTLLNVANLSPKVAERLKKAEKEHFHIIEAKFARGIKEGIIREAPVQFMSIVGIGMLQGAMDILLRSPIPMTSAQQEAFLKIAEDVLIKGLLSDKQLQ